MSPRVHPIAIVLALVAFVACGGGEDAQPAQFRPLDAGGDAAPPALDVPRPGPRDAQRQAAWRGIDFQGERARIVPEVAAELVAGPDAAAAARAIEEGRELLTRNAVIEACAAHTRAVLLAPEDARAWHELGDTLLMDRRGEQALAVYRAGLALDGSSASLHEGAARALVGLGRRAEAISELRAAVELDPRRAEAFGLLALQSYYLEDDAAAWDAVHRAEELGGSVPPQFRALLAKRTAKVR